MANDSPVQFKGTTLKIIQTLLRTTDKDVLHAALAELTGNSPDFFENELAILDFSQIDFAEAAEAAAKPDWKGIVRLLRQSGLNAVATVGLPEKMATAAAAAGLPPATSDALSRQRAKAAEPAATPSHATPAAATAPSAPAPAQAAPAAPASAPAPEAPRTVTLDKPLRSGQRFYAKGCDLIVTAMVSAGAEVIADGHIHVYAPLRGRALAGASGDKTARIFTTSLEAELVSVAGLYRTFDAGVPAELLRQPATVTLVSEGDGQGEPKLNIAPLALR